MSAAIKLNELLYDSLESLSLPDVCVRLREVMESENASMRDAAGVISLDPALVARVLRMANSAFYGFRSQVDTVSRAANILGMQKIHDWCWPPACRRPSRASATNSSTSTPSGIAACTVAFAQAIAEGAGLRNTESMFVRGLLHDIGHLVLFTRYPLECRHALAHADEGLDAAAVRGTTADRRRCDAVAAELARAWQLPVIR